MDHRRRLQPQALQTFAARISGVLIYPQGETCYAGRSSTMDYFIVHRALEDLVKVEAGPSAPPQTIRRCPAGCVCAREPQAVRPAVNLAERLANCTGPPNTTSVDGSTQGPATAGGRLRVWCSFACYQQPRPQRLRRRPWAERSADSPTQRRASPRQWLADRIAQLARHTQP